MRLAALAVTISVGWAALIAGAAWIGERLPSVGAITFEGMRDGQSDIFALDLGSGALVNLTRDPADDFSAVWSPDGERMIFVRERANLPYVYQHLYQLNRRTHRVEPLMTQAIISGRERVQLAWSPDGEWLAYNVMVDQPYLYLLNMRDPANSVDLIDSMALSREMAWSPDSKLLLFSRPVYGSTLIMTYHVDTGDVTPLTQPLPDQFVTDYAGAWSPNGTEIAFISDRGGSHQLYMMNADGSDLRLLNQRFTYLWSRPLWTPDGRGVVVVGQIDAAFYLMRVDANTGETVLVNDPSQIIGIPMITPDGSRFVTMSRSGRGSVLFTIRADGSDWRRLPIGEGGAAYPLWLPHS